MCYAFLTNTYKLQDHGSNYGLWTMTLSSGNNPNPTPDPTPTPTPVAKCYGTSLVHTSAGYLNATYDNCLGVVVFDVCVHNNMYLGIGFGESMENTDMVYWGANGDNSMVLDLYSTQNAMPTVDSVNVYNTTQVQNYDGSMTFKSLRALNPNTGSETFVIQLDKTIKMCAAYLTNTY